MIDENTVETVARAAAGHENRYANWTRVEGVVGIGALLTSFVWFLGMPTGMAVGVGFGIVLVLDFVRALLFGASRSEGDDFETAELAGQSRDSPGTGGVPEQ